MTTITKEEFDETLRLATEAVTSSFRKVIGENFIGQEIKEGDKERLIDEIIRLTPIDHDFDFQVKTEENADGSMTISFAVPAEWVK